MKPPEYLGPYRIGETLGTGGMGSVFKAKHAKSGQDVAVKLIASQMSDEMRFRRRFDTEVKTLKLLSHPNIVKLIGFGEEHGMLFYSMEYVEGETLQEMIRQQKKLPWMTALDISIQVCAALKHAHDFGVTHRDLKPANLVVQRDGTVKLLDFGISKIFGENQTAVGSIMGTADYMAPEQADGTGVTSRTDLFALGCVMYAMLCGKPPFRGKNITEVISALQHKDPVPLDLIDPDLPDDVVQIVGELLEKQPEKRPPTALAVMNRLKAMRAGLHRMQTLSDRTGDKPEPPSGAGTKHQSADEPASDKPDAGRPTSNRSGPEFDTTGPEKPNGGKQTRVQSGKTRPEDTVPFWDIGDGNQTSVANVDPSARTVHTDGHSGKRGTVLSTAVTAPLGDDRSADDSTSDPDAPSNLDTSVGLSGKTHFQTVSDGEVREGFFVTPKTKTEHPALRIVSIAALSLILLSGVVFLVVSTRGPTAEELLAKIETPDDSVQSFQIQDEMERFLKLFPDHPKADEIRQREKIYRVEAAVRRLKLKAKLRTSEGPLYETTFLEAMALRQSNPLAAREKLRQWIAVFGDADDDEGEPARLARLAEFEIARLTDVQSETDGTPGDPKLVELMQRIDNAEQLPAEQRRALLEGIVTLYEGQPWASQARQRAMDLLHDPPQDDPSQ
ncbi:Serine/threonine-protein kinase PknB [Stieleria neptunia]|uniref:non-specific serine/threonine protein kinase n=1 Tax=Stieleria neptunia TaxID=2527979 RepID=A0A518HLI7_9BACT|nr:serine/threonine-protein kinase [Stieleria neptunia]QDV41707.1 Serine/threonine-protein kinase PknB [Stieleria neptunia]